MVPKLGWKWPRKRLPEQSNSSSIGVPSGFDKVLHHAPSLKISAHGANRVGHEFSLRLLPGGNKVPGTLDLCFHISRPMSQKFLGIHAQF